MKYPKLEEPCKSCIGKCCRVEEPTFIKDENCRYREKENKPWGIKCKNIGV